MIKKIATGLLTLSLVMSPVQPQIQWVKPSAKAYSGTGQVQFFIGQNFYNVDESHRDMDAVPYIKNGRTFIPVRFLGDGLAAQTEYKDNRVVTVTKDGKTVKMTIGSAELNVNGLKTYMDVVPEIKGGRTYLPARFVAEAFGYEVGFANNTVTVSKPVPLATGPFDPVIKRLDMTVGSTQATATRMDGSKYTVTLDAPPVLVYPNKPLWDETIARGLIKTDIYDKFPPYYDSEAAGGMYVPLASVAKAFGVPAQNIKWDGNKLKIYLRPDLYYVFTKDSKIIDFEPKISDGRKDHGTMKFPSRVINGQLMVSSNIAYGLLFSAAGEMSVIKGLQDFNCGDDIPTGCLSLACLPL